MLPSRHGLLSGNDVLSGFDSGEDRPVDLSMTRRNLLGPTLPENGCTARPNLFVTNVAAPSHGFGTQDFAGRARAGRRGRRLLASRGSCMHILHTFI